VFRESEYYIILANLVYFLWSNFVGGNQILAKELYAINPPSTLRRLTPLLLTKI
jgi:hypothetical protein